MILKPLSSLVLYMKNGTTTEQNQDGRGFPVTRIETISEGVVNAKRTRFVELGEGNVERWRLHHGDILLSHINSVEHIGKSAIYQSDPEILIHGMNLLLLRPNRDLVTPEYLHFGLRSGGAREYIRARCKRAVNQASINQKELGALELPIPSLEEQHHVVDLLSRAEGIVRLRREAEAKAQSIIPALFVDMFGDPATNPKRWPVVALGDVLRAADYGSSTKASDTGAGLPLIRMGNVSYDGALDLTDLKYVELEPHDAERFRLRKGDILFNRTNSKELVGKTGLWDADLDAVVASYFIRLRVDESRVRPFYVWAFMNSRHMKRILFGTARGAIGQANINSKELKAFRLPLPTLQTQAEFEERCRELMGLRALQGRALQTAEHTFASILAKSFGS